ncbi:MAG: hypothetical protein AB7F23_03495 [Phycisphaerae bacterium]|jgi:hypothetical protein
MKNHLILGVHITERLKHAGEVQAVLTKYGDVIKTRLGLHDVKGGMSGVLILECVCDDDEFAALKEELAAVGGIETQSMVFSH